MYHHACRFIDDQEVIILKYNIQVHFFRNNISCFGRQVRINDDLVKGLDLIILFYFFVIDKNQPGINGLLEFVAGSSFNPVHQEFINPVRFLPFVGIEGKPLVQFITGFSLFLISRVVQIFSIHKAAKIWPWVLNQVNPEVQRPGQLYYWTRLGKFAAMLRQTVEFRDLGQMDYKNAWDYQEKLLQGNLRIKAEAANQADASLIPSALPTINHLLFVEHPPVYTLGKSGNIDHVLINEEERKLRGIEFYHTNRGGDITFHGPQQIVGYPILDLEKFYTDIGRYLRDLEEVIILTLAEYGITSGRSAGETGVWIDAEIKGKERKICAMGVRCSRWITMHGFALNVNTDLNYFNHIIPCGIQNKKVTSIREELGREVDIEDVKEKLKENFSKVFHVSVVNEGQNSFAR
jgi:lipoyl(octanoyl) transferase